MAKAVAKFEKVSFEEFVNSSPFIGSEDRFRELYNDIKLPERKTSGSAGYDFSAPNNIILSPGETALVPTGIKCRINNGWVLKLYPRSGLGFKYRLQLNNTVGIIDSDYYNNPNNEGHIMAKITNDTNENKAIFINKGDGFMQGVFVEYGITEDDIADGVRVGGFGSTD